MKPKLLIITYADKVVLAIVALVLLWGIGSVFRGGSEKVVKLDQEFTTSEDMVKKHLRESGENVPKPESTAIPAFLDRGFDHPEVSPRLRNWIIYNREAHEQTFRVAVGTTRRYELPNVKIISKRPLGGPAKALLGAEYFYEPRTNISTIVFTGKKIGPEAITVVFFDSEETEYRFYITVGTREPLAKPLSPVDVSIYPARGLIVVRARYRQPVVVTNVVTQAQGVRIYRKPAGALDNEYRRVGPETIKRVTSEKLWKEVLEKYGPNAGENVTSGGAAAPGPGPGGSGAPPEVAPTELNPQERPAGGAAGYPGVGAAAEKVVIPENQCVYFDREAEPGRTYDYKVVAVSLDDPTVESGAVEISAVYLAPDILFYCIGGIPPDIARVEIQKHSYDYNQWFTRSGSFRPGEPIVLTMRARVQTPGAGEAKSVEINLDTGCVLVDATPQITAFRTRVAVTGALLQAALNSKIVYVDKAGRLEEKWRETPPKR